MTADDQPVRMVKLHPTLDLALLKVDSVTGAVPMAEKLPEFGDRLVAIGWQAGHVLQVTDGRAAQELGKMSCPVTLGASGGAVLNERGEIVGTIAIVFMWRTVHIQTMRSTRYAVPMAHISGYTPLDAKVQLWIKQTTR
jgi:hypothetical protein